MAHFSGKAGDFTYAGTAMEVTSWTATATSDLLETTDKGSNGFREYIAGLRGCEANIDMHWDSAIHSGNPPAMTDGTSGAATLEISDGGDSISGTFLIETFEITSAVDGTVDYSVSGKFTGQFYLPGEATS